MCLGIQLVTGLFLAIHYSRDVEFDFDSVSHIIRDVNIKRAQIEGKRAYLFIQQLF